MPSISTVITAPKGIAECLIPDALLVQADGATLEVIIADGSTNAADTNRLGLRHIRLPGEAVFGLRRIGLASATKDWILLLEDHCRPLPGWLDRFSDAIETNPGIDLFSGGVTNDTSVSHWSWASFIYTDHILWTRSNKIPNHASISNLAVRRSAILPSELAQDGGFDLLTLPRLARSGRYMHCASAVVDHVQHFSLRESCAAHFHNARCHGAFQRNLLGIKGRLLIAEIVKVLRETARSPREIMQDLQDTEHHTSSMGVRFIILAVATAGGRFCGLLTGSGRSAFTLR